jgi:hypothetical protein
MNKTFTKEQLASWIAGLIDAAKNDEQFDVAWFDPTKESRFSIIGGWVNFAPGFEDLFCVSKSRPDRAMCVDVVDNEDTLITEEEVEPTHVILEWDDSPEVAAEFFMHEWERLTEKFEVN